MLLYLLYIVFLSGFLYLQKFIQLKFSSDDGLGPESCRDLPRPYFVAYTPLCNSRRCIKLGRIGLGFKDHRDLKPPPYTNGLIGQRLGMIDCGY